MEEFPAFIIHCRGKTTFARFFCLILSSFAIVESGGKNKTKQVLPRHQSRGYLELTWGRNAPLPTPDSVDSLSDENKGLTSFGDLQLGPHK